MRVFITGLTGSIGDSLARLHHSRGDQVWGCSRGEAGASRWLACNAHVATLYVCHAACLADRLSDVGRLLASMDRVYHCAAMKHVDLCEQQPDEAVAQNVTLTSVVASACHEQGVPLVFTSTDKACLPTGVYGATKAIAERLVVRLGGAVARLGNVVGSSGSVFERWRDQAARGERITLTDPEMTRYFMGLQEATEFLADRCVPGCVAMPRPLLAARMGDVAWAIGGEVRVVGRRPGETRHQWIVSPDEGATVEERRILTGLGTFGTPILGGLSSDTAGRWDVDELLALAGVRR